MTCEEKVSIIIPVYNIKDYVDACISSVCRQTYRNIEIIVIDDGSTDGSAQICEFWKGQDKRINVIHKQNEGLSSARNEGLKHATGKYILFVDGDDRVDDVLLERTIPYMECGMEMVAFGYRLAYKDKNVQEIKFPAKEYLMSDKNDKINFIIGPFFKYEYGWNAWNRIFLKEYIDKFEIKFVDTKKIFAEDQLFCLCYLAHCSKVKMLDICLYDYVQRDGSIMNETMRDKNYHFAQLNELSIALREYYSMHEDCLFLLPEYAVIHYLIIERAIQKTEGNDVNAKEIRKNIRNDIMDNSDLEYFDKQIQSFKNTKRILKIEYSFLSIMVKTLRVKELMTGKSIMYRLMLIIYKIRSK